MFGQFLPCCCDRERYVIRFYGLSTWQVHILSFLNLYVYCIIPNSLFTTISFKRAKTVHLQEPIASFCGVLIELSTAAHWHSAQAADPTVPVSNAVPPRCLCRWARLLLLSLILLDGADREEVGSGDSSVVRALDSWLTMWLWSWSLENVWWCTWNLVVRLEVSKHLVMWLEFDKHVMVQLELW